MYCRVFNQFSNTYYRSMVYGLFLAGQDNTYIVLNPRTDCFELVPQFPDGDDLQPPLAALIQCDQQGWECLTGASLLPLKRHMRGKGLECPYDFLFGYPEVCRCMPLLTDLIGGHDAPAARYGIPRFGLTDTDVWHYLHTQTDADALMRRYDGFHDAFLVSLLYQEASGSARIDHREPGPAQIIATYDIPHEHGCIELCFEGVLTAQLQPPLEHHDRAIFCAALTVTDEAILWAEGEEETTCIKALSMKWRHR